MSHNQPTPWHQEILELRRDFNKTVTRLRIKKMTQGSLDPSELLTFLGQSSEIQDAQFLILLKTVFGIDKKVEKFVDEKFIELLTTDVEGLIETTNDIKNNIKKINEDLDILTDLITDLAKVTSDIQKRQIQLMKSVKNT